MKTEIKTHQKFIIRLEDVYYLILGVILIIFGFIISKMVKENVGDSSFLPTKIFLIFIVSGVSISILLIFLSFKKRQKDKYFMTDDVIVRERNGKKIYELPIRKIVSIRVNNKKGARGTIIFFTNEASKDYFFTYTPFNMKMPMEIFGLTSMKINLALDAKSLLQEIHKINSKINYIGTY